MRLLLARWRRGSYGRGVRSTPTGECCRRAASKEPAQRGLFLVDAIIRSMTRRQRTKRKLALLFWRVFNPGARALAGWAPWWVVLETVGRRSGRPRRVPLARGPQDGSTVWLISVHGRHASFARNIEANPRVRLKLARRW